MEAARSEMASNPATSRGLRAWAARRPLTAFLVLTFTLAYPLVSLPILASHGVIPGGSLPRTLHIAPDELAGFLMVVSIFPAAVLVTWCAEGSEGVKRLLRRMSRWRVGVGWWLLLLVGLPVLATALALVLGDSPRSIDPAGVFFSQLGFLLVNFIVTNLWEEAGWAGFLQTRLERRHNLFLAAVLTAVPFAFMHWPLAFFGDFTASSLLVALIAYFLLGLIFRPMIGVFLRGTRDSVLAVAVLHSVFNRTANENGIVAHLVEGDARGVATPLAVIVLTTLTAVVIRRRLTRAYRVELDALARRPAPGGGD